MPSASTPCPECGRPGLHFVPPSLGEPGFYYCRRPQAPKIAVIHGLRIGTPAGMRPWSPPADPIEAAKAEALQELVLDVFVAPAAEPRDPFERWEDVEVES